MEFIWNLRPNSWKHAYRHSWQSSLLTIPPCICSPCETVQAGKDCGVQNPVSECSCEHHSHAHQILTHRERHVSFSLNFHVSRYLSLLQQLFSVRSIVLSFCSAQGRYVLSVVLGTLCLSWTTLLFRVLQHSSSAEPLASKQFPPSASNVQQPFYCKSIVLLSIKKTPPKLYWNNILRFH